MNFMYRYFFCLLLILNINFLFSSECVEHPRLFWTNYNDSILRKEFSNTTYKNVIGTLLAECDELLETPLLKREVRGRRLLFVSVEAKKRISILSFAWRLTGDVKYAIRAEKEMLNVCSFINWNPSHFLDVAEMCAGVAIGYDWLYDYLSLSSKKKIEEGLYNLGLSLCLKEHGWMKLKNNWNQVCNGGTVMAAIALSDKYPEETKKIIEKALKTIKLPMSQYGKNGAFPEGPGYWGYGTSYNVMLFSALETSYKNSIDLPINDNFMNSAKYVYNMLGPTNLLFNYSDNGSSYSFNPCMFWFATKLNNGNIASFEWKMLENNNISNIASIPLGLIWAANSPKPDNESGENPLYYYDNGKTPVVAMRTSWSDKNAWFVAMKGGTVNIPHGHMDNGTFVFDADGERWVMDLGGDNYTNLEINGVDLWNMRSQDSERWQMFRYRNQSHNTLTFNDELQLINRHCNISLLETNDELKKALIDLSPVYKQKEVIRTMSLFDKKLVIDDKIVTGDSCSILRWNIVTDAKIKIKNNKTVCLEKNGKIMNMIISGEDYKIKEWSSKPKNHFENQNKGISVIGFETKLEANRIYNFKITFVQ